MPLNSNTNPDTALQRYTGLASLAGRREALGRPTGGRLTRRMNRLSAYLPEGVDPESIQGIDWGGDFNLSEANALRGLANRFKPGSSAIRPGAWDKQNEQLLTENTVQAGKDKFYGEGGGYDQMGQAASSLSDLASKPAFGEDYLTRARSSLASTIKGAEQDRLRRVSAVLGLRGMDPSSPAGAALATRTALDSDAEVARAFSGIQQQAISGNQSAARTNASLLSQLSLARTTAQRAVDSGDMEALSKVNTDLSGILEAVRAEFELHQYQNQQAREAGANYWKDAGVNAFGAIVSGGTALLTGGVGGSKSGGNPPLTGYTNDYGRNARPLGSAGNYQSPAGFGDTMGSDEWMYR